VGHSVYYNANNLCCVHQGWTNTRRKVVVAPNICWSQVGHLLHVNFMTSGILNWRPRSLDNLCTPGLYNNLKKRRHVLTENYYGSCGFGGIEVACWPLVPKFGGLEVACWPLVPKFWGEEILSTPSFGGEVKPSVPCRSFTACKRYLNVTCKSVFRQNYRTFLAHSSTFRL